MLRKELEYALNWTLAWLENGDNRYRIARLIAEILEDVEEIRRDFPR